MVGLITSPRVLVELQTRTAGGKMKYGEGMLLYYSWSQTILYPGDIIILNTNWWVHQTKVLEGDLSITITNEFD